MKFETFFIKFNNQKFFSFSNKKLIFSLKFKIFSLLKIIFSLLKLKSKSKIFNINFKPFFSLISSEFFK